MKCNRTEKDISPTLGSFPTLSNQKISNKDEQFPIFNVKRTIDAVIGHAHDQESSRVCISWPGFTNFMRLRVEEMSVEEPWCHR